ncbi:MAG TPA: hypothetical protein PL037_10105, partial [Elusimicrobiales bacterium]|nr:hypothetical protein [Elusimicrobiales bacterium]
MKERGGVSLFYPGPAGPPGRPALLAAVLVALRALAPAAAPAVEWEMMDKFVVDGASTFKSSVTITVPASQSASLWASTSTMTPHLFVATSGNVGIRTASPQGRLDVLSAGSNPTDMVQIWRNSGGVIQGSMSATGVMMAKKFIGDGALLTNISVSGIAGTPALTFGTANGAGSAGTLIRTDAAIAIFNDGAMPDPLGTAAAGTDAYAARRDHVHPLPYGGTANQIYGTNSGATAGEWKA